MLALIAAVGMFSRRKWAGIVWSCASAIPFVIAAIGANVSQSSARVAVSLLTLQFLLAYWRRGDSTVPARVNVGRLAASGLVCVNVY
jgi:hypothetical protein